MLPLLLATGNPNKLRELRRIIPAKAFRLVSLNDVDGDVGLPDETGSTYRDNSRLKAQAAAAAAGCLALADDSGLEVDCLDGAPGVFSARYGSGDSERIDRLLSDIGERFPAPAKFVCVASIAMPDGRCRSFRGECSGVVIATRRGSNGFGFDPVFLVDGRDETMAELPSLVKNRLSHRSKAVRSLFSWLSRKPGILWLKSFSDRLV